MFVRAMIAFGMASLLCAGGCAAAGWQGETGQANGQEGKTNQQGVVPEYSIGGVVVDTVTGKGVPHALVEVSIEGRVGERRPGCGE